MSTQVIYPLGETAAAIRGENELWLAMILRNKVLLNLKPAQLAAVCGSLVSEGIKVRPWKSNRLVFLPNQSYTFIFLIKNFSYELAINQLLHSEINKLKN